MTREITRDMTRERWRPAFHFTPERNWMNDPNGLVFYAGEYHLFFQHNPFGDRWGHMSWGHAVSPDLVHWERLPLALAEEDGEMVFSGSVVVDWANSGGFGDGFGPGEPPIVAIYTGHRTDRPLQAQCLAFSTDRGRRWARYSGNPVLDIGEKDFRDPKVFWHAPTERWVMAVALPELRRVRFYSSTDLKIWAHLSDFGPAGSTTGIWECPDLFPLPVQAEVAGEGAATGAAGADGVPGADAWILVVNVATGAPAGGSGTQYFVGRFDGVDFVADDSGATEAGPLWADYGRDFYAAVSWSDVPATDGRRIWIGWMSNWDYAQDVPTSPWRSAMTVPRELSLRRTSAGLRLVQRPIAETATLRGDRRSRTGMTAAEATEWLAGLALAGGLAELIVQLRPGAARQFGVRLRHGDSDATTITCDLPDAAISIERGAPGLPGLAPFDAAFAGTHKAPLRPEGGSVTLHFLCDASSVEVFVDGGETVLTDILLPHESGLTFEIFADSDGLTVEAIELWPLKSALG